MENNVVLDKLDKIKLEACADVASLCITIDTNEEIICSIEAHKKIIQVKYILTLGEFKKMFYADGDDFFCIADIYDSPLDRESIYNSAWGKEIISKCCSNVHCKRFTRKIINFNKLGGLNNYPLGVFLGYGETVNPKRTFFAQKYIIKNMERDLKVSVDKWSNSSRMKIENQLFKLSFVPENDEDLCVNIVKGRTWQEVLEILNQNPEQNDIGENSIIGLFINVKIKSKNIKINPTLLRLKYIVKIEENSCF